MTTEVIRQEAFDDVQLAIIEQNGEEWFTAEDIGKALEFSEPRKHVLNLFNRNRDEFEGLYRVLNLRTRLKSGLKLPNRLTVFNPQGAYLLAILARTEKSKALRRWLAKFMAHGLNRLREHVVHLENRHQADQEKIRRLTRPRGRPQKLPASEQAPELKKDHAVLVNFKELRQLYDYAYRAGIHEEEPEFAPGYLARVLNRDEAVPRLKLEFSLPVTLSGLVI